jgi:hypothetical protein
MGSFTELQKNFYQKYNLNNIYIQRLSFNSTKFPIRLLSATLSVIANHLASPETHLLSCQDHGFSRHHPSAGRIAAEPLVVPEELLFV